MAAPVNVQGRVGLIKAADGVDEQIRLGAEGAQVVQDAHGRYHEGAVRGNMFYAASQAVATTTVGLSTTYTGLVISNPVNSAVNLSLITASINQSVIQATQPEAYGLAFGFNATTNVTHTAAATPVSTKIGSGATPTAKVDTSATLPTAPTYGLFLANTASATTLGTGGAFDIAGQFVIAPGGYALFVTPAQASVAGLWFSFTWEEIAI